MTNTTGQMNNKELARKTIACVTSSHIYFHGKVSILSDHYRVGPQYSFQGRDAIEVITKLTLKISKFRPEKKILERELDTTLLSYGVLKSSWFETGQQFMAAFKACVFDQDPVHWSSDGLDAEELWQRHIYLLERSVPEASWNTPALSALPLVAILRSESPYIQRRIARRQLPNFEADKWAHMSDIVYTAAIICRAKNDSSLLKIIVGSGNRKFVEAAPSDGVWGVRLNQDSDLILDENRWRGRNRSGWCFGRAREYLRGDELTDGDEDGLIGEDQGEEPTDGEENGLMDTDEDGSTTEDEDGLMTKLAR